MTWGSIEGDIKIKNMSDTHVVNIVHLLENSRIPNMIKKYEEALNKGDEPLSLYIESCVQVQESILDNFKKEMEFRKLPESMLDNAPYPFKDKKGD